MPILPVDALAERFRSTAGTIVLSAPPGSGKSTRVPSWCDTPVLVVQPRRMAARSLASHLGDGYGFAVRGESRNPDAPIVFVTTGVALRMLADRPHRFKTVILDEFHERSLELDLLAAVAMLDDTRLVLLSATIDSERIASALEATAMTGEGRMFPVDVRYSHVDRTLPSEHDLPGRVRRAILEATDATGDVLVFTPGKAEIQAVSASLGDLGEVVPLHGGLDLSAQARAMRAGSGRRIVVSTNVAETSVTIPGVGLVIDSGLVRRTHYFQDRGYLALSPIAQSSADQRSGRAGRVGPGIAVRLWGKVAPLSPHTPPEIQRESLVPLVLAAAALGHVPEALPFVDPPAPHAIATARAHLVALGALDGTAITDRGRQLFDAPMDARLARLVLEARGTNAITSILDLVAALSARRPLFRGRATDLDDPRLTQMGDASAILAALERDGLPGVDPRSRREVRTESARLHRLFSVERLPQASVDALADVILRAWPDSAYVARRRKRRVAWSNGGTEVMLDGYASASDDSEALLALDLRASGAGRDRVQRITAAIPRTLRHLAAAGIGQPRLGPLTVERGRVSSAIETVYCGVVLAQTDATPTGELAVAAVTELLLANRLWKRFAHTLQRAHERRDLYERLEGRDGLAPVGEWLLERVRASGLSTPDELSMLERADLLPEPLDDYSLAELDREFPPILEHAGLRLRVEVRPEAELVVLHNLKARIKTQPRGSWIPRFRGWSVVLEDRGVRTWIRRR